MKSMELRTLILQGLLQVPDANVLNILMVTACSCYKPSP